MLEYLLKRILSSVILLFILIASLFFFIKFVPGGPFDSESALSPEVKKQLNEIFYLNQSSFSQFIKYIQNIFSGNLGSSYLSFGNRSVNEIIVDALPISLYLGLIAFLITLLFGVIFGMISAFYKNKWIDKTLSAFFSFGISIPNYFLASMLILIFGTWLKILPIALWEGWKSVILPSIALSLRPICLIARVTRASLIEELTLEYIRTARAKGLDFKIIVFKHALRNSFVAIITVLGSVLTSLIGGSFVIESIFAIPGMGRQYINAVIDRDYILLIGLTITYGVFVILSNLLIDFIYHFIDPRIKLEES